MTCSIGALAVGASATRSVTVTVPLALAGSTVVNTATVHGDQGDDHPENDTDTATTQVGPASDLSIVKTAPANVSAAGTITWTLGVSNRGPSPATAVTVADTLSNGVTLVSATPSQGACSAQGPSISCALGTIASGAAAQVQIVGRIDASLAGTTLVNTATVGGAEPDPVTADNTSTASSIVGAPITGGAAGGGGAAATPRATIAVEKTTSRTKPVEPGQKVTYRIRVRTTSSVAALDVTVCDHLPAGLTYVSAHGAHFRSGNACWSIARLAPHASRSFTVVARVGIDAHAGIARNTAVASARNARQVKSTASIHVVRRTAERPRPNGVTG